MKQNLKAACGYGAAFLWLLMTEIIIGIYGLGIVRSYGGDVLVIPLLYCLVRMVTKICPRTLPLWLWGAGLFTELLQLCNLAERLGFPEGSLPAVLLGTRADWMDVLCYGVGTALIYAAMGLLHRFSHMPQKPRCMASVLGTLALASGSVFCWANMAITYRFDYDADWMLHRSLSAVQARYIRYDAQAGRSIPLEEQGYVLIAQDCYFHDAISSAGDFYYLYYAKCDENNIVTDVQVVDTGIGG